MPNMNSQKMSHNRKMLEDKAEERSNATAEINACWMAIVY